MQQINCYALDIIFVWDQRLEDMLKGVRRMKNVCKSCIRVMHNFSVPKNFLIWQQRTHKHHKHKLWNVISTCEYNSRSLLARCTIC